MRRFLALALVSITVGAATAHAESDKRRAEAVIELSGEA
jgi:hypothetical protein